MNKARVGIIVDNLNSSKQIFDFIKMSLKSKNYEVTHLIVQRNSAGSNQNLFKKIKNYLKKRGIKKFLSAVTFKIILKLESLFFKRIKKFSSFFDTYSLKEFDLNIIEVYPIISEKDIFYRYSENDLQKIKSLDLNLLIRGGTGILKGEILKVCKNGIISFHHGDNEFYRGGPPGFWEIVNKETRTGFIIQKLGEELDSGDVLFKGYFTTHWVYTLNLINLLEKSNIFLHQVIDKLTSNTLENEIKNKNKILGPIYTLPPVTTLIFYFFSTLKRFLVKWINKTLIQNQNWNVAYQFTDKWKNIDLSKVKKIPNPPNRYLADPFIVKKNENHYCFVEDYNIKNQKGCISVYEINNNICKEIGVALKENFHLSYPFLFNYENELYMCPETHEAQDIRLYKCVEFPLKWQYVKSLITNVSAVDTSIFFKNEKWWLMTNLSNSSIEDHASELHIFSCKNLLLDEWKPHKNNPVIFDPFYARNGGFISEFDNFYRVYQKPGFDNYGESLGVSKIEELNDNNYKENNEFKVLPNFIKNIKGTHTYNFSDGLLVLDYLKISKE